LITCEEIKDRNLAEKYLLHELTSEEEEIYELHYLNCAHCSQELNLMNKIIKQVQEKAKVESAEELDMKPISLLEPITKLHILRNKIRDLWLYLDHLLIVHPRPVIVALTILIIAMIYPTILGIFSFPELENRVIKLVSPRINSYPFTLYPSDGIKAADRSNLNLIEIPSYSEIFFLEFRPDIQDEYERYDIIINDRDGNLIWQDDGLNPSGRYGTFSISCNKIFFNEDSYSITLYGVKGATIKKLDTFPFTIVKN
jgi:hypothetical protein